MLTLAHFSDLEMFASISTTTSFLASSIFATSLERAVEALTCHAKRDGRWVRRIEAVGTRRDAHVDVGSSQDP